MKIDIFLIFLYAHSSNLDCHAVQAREVPSTRRENRHFKEGHVASSIFSVQDLLVRLGAQVARTSGSRTALVAINEDLVLRGLGMDADRVAALGSDDPERARKGWSKRRVNLKDSAGRETDIARVVQIRFQGSERLGGVPDIGISAIADISDLGRVEIMPRYVLGIPYIQRAKGGLFEGTRPFVGVLYAPMKAKQAYRFVPFDLLDQVYITAWNQLVERGKSQGNKYGSFAAVEKLEVVPVGKIVKIKVAPAEKEMKKFDRTFRGHTRQVKEMHYGTLFGKTLVGAPRSQQIPNSLVRANVKQVEDGKDRTNFVEVQAFERDGSILIFVGGDDAFLTIDEVEESTTPFDALDMPPEHFSPQRAHQHIGEWLKRPLDERNVLFQKGLQYGLINPAQARSDIRATLEAFFKQQVRRAETMMDEALSITIDLLNDREPPSITECLSGKTLGVTLEQLTENDVAAAWITAQLEVGCRYSHAVPFFRELRKRVLKAAAAFADPPYRDPEPAKTDMPAQPPKGVNGDANAAPSEDEPAKADKPKPKRGPRKPRVPKAKAGAESTADTTAS